MAQNHIDQVLKTAGLPEDQIKALKDLPEDSKDFTTDPFVAPIKTAFETQVKNDPKFYEGLNRENLPKEFVQKLETEQYGRSASQVRQNLMKNLGMSEKDFSDLGEEGKKLDIFLPAVIKKLSEGKLGDKELQAKLIEANTELERLRNDIPTIETKFKGEYESKINDFTVSQNVLTILASVPGLKGRPEYASEKLIRDLKGDYAFAVENGRVELRQKNNPALKVLTDNNTKELTLAAAINQRLEADDMVDKKKTSTTTTTTTNVGVTSGGGLKLSKHVNDKVQKEIDADARIARQ